MEDDKWGARGCRGRRMGAREDIEDDGDEGEPEDAEDDGEPEEEGVSEEDWKGRGVR